jgi:DNA-binding transcriptional regulator YiaG
MITEIPELHPNKLLYSPYNYSTDSLAELLGVSKYTVESWLYKKRSPQSPVKKLCYLVSTGELIATKSES